MKKKIDIRVSETDNKIVWSATLNGVFAGQGTSTSFLEAVSEAGDAIVLLNKNTGGA